MQSSDGSSLYDYVLTFHDYGLLFFVSSDTPGCKDVLSVRPDDIAEHRANLTFDEALPLSEADSFGGLATNGCHSDAAFPLFVIYIYLSAFVMMNVFLAVVLDAFGAQSTEKKGIVPNSVFDGFLKAWRQVDDDMDLFITVPQLLTVLTYAPQPLGIGARPHKQKGDNVPPSGDDVEDEEPEDAQTVRRLKRRGSVEVEGSGVSTARIAARLETASARRHISNALRTVYGNLNVSLFRGHVYFYDVCTELLRVLAVEKARARNENDGIFFQSRAAIAKLNAIDGVLFRKLKGKWCACVLCVLCDLCFVCVLFLLCLCESRCA